MEQAKESIKRQKKKVFRNLGSKVGLKRDFIGCVCGLEWDNWKLF